MKSIWLTYGKRALIASIGIFLAGFVAGKVFKLSYAAQEVIGYLTIVLALLFVFFGVKEFRDTTNKGSLTFWEGLTLGMGITLFVALGSAVADFIYVTVIHPDFVTDYTAYQIEKLGDKLSPEVFASRREELLQQAKDIGHPMVMAAIMFATVMVMGFIMSLLSTLVLRR